MCPGATRSEMPRTCGEGCSRLRSAVLPQAAAGRGRPWKRWPTPRRGHSGGRLWKQARAPGSSVPGPCVAVGCPLSSALGRPCHLELNKSYTEFASLITQVRNELWAPGQEAVLRWVAGGARAWQRCGQRSGGPRALLGPVPPARDWVRARSQAACGRSAAASTAALTCASAGASPQGPSAGDLGPSTSQHLLSCLPQGCSGSRRGVSAPPFPCLPGNHPPDKAKVAFVRPLPWS